MWPFKKKTKKKKTKWIYGTCYHDRVAKKNSKTGIVWMLFEYNNNGIHWIELIKDSDWSKKFVPDRAYCGKR